MNKPGLSPRQQTIERLQNFLQESINMEPELEQFVKTLISFLEAASHRDGEFPYIIEPGKISSKVH